MESTVGTHLSLRWSSRGFQWYVEQRHQNEGADQSLNYQPVYIITWLASIVLPFTKLTFLIFYTQLFRPFKWLRVLCYIGIVFTSLAFLGFFIAQMALLTPHPGEQWLEMDMDPREQACLKYLSLPITSTSLGIDLYIFVLPMLGVSKLQMSRRRKLGVVLMFLTGFSYDLLRIVLAEN